MPLDQGPDMRQQLTTTAVLLLVNSKACRESHTIDQLVHFLPADIGISKIHLDLLADVKRDMQCD